MLPKIPEKSKDSITYQYFTRQLMTKKISQSNFSKLKLIKEFLEEEEQITQQTQRTRLRQHRKSDSADRTLDMLRVREDKDQVGKNEGHTYRIRRQSVTSQARKKQAQDKQNAKDRSSIFSIPDRFKLNELLANCKKSKRTFFGDIYNNSIKMNTQLYTHRIL